MEQLYVASGICGALAISIAVFSYYVGKYKGFILGCNTRAKENQNKRDEPNRLERKIS